MGKEGAEREGGKRARPAPGRVLPILARRYPDVRCGLGYAGPLQLLVATILSAQCTDARVNRVTPALFARFPGAEALARARLPEIERIVRSCGFFRQKARAIRATCRAIVAEHGGEVPRDREALVRLPGVGRKTANVVLNEAFGAPAIAVDTHVLRTSGRLGWVETKDPLRAERQLMERVPRRWWKDFSLLMIHHGRQTCSARRPACAACPVLRYCPFGQGVISSSSVPSASAGSAASSRGGGRG